MAPWDCCEASGAMGSIGAVRCRWRRTKLPLLAATRAEGLPYGIAVSLLDDDGIGASLLPADLRRGDGGAALPTPAIMM